MKKYINALLYGDKGTKKYIWGLIGLSALTVILIVGAAAGHTIALGIAGLFAAMADVLWYQSRSLSDVKMDRDEKKKKSRTKQTGPSQKHEAAKKESDGPHRLPGKDDDVLVGGNEEKAKPAVKEEKEKDKEEESHEDSDIPVPKDFSSLTEEELDYTLKKYRVNGKRQVIIDSCPSLDFYERPAYIWSDRHHYYLLVISDREQPVRLKFSLHDNMKIYYRRAVECDPPHEYEAYREPSLISTAFGLFMPDYYQRRTNHGITWNKNLYRLSDDMFFTNHSAKNVFDVTGASFEMEDEVTIEETHGGDFKEAYKLNILWRDSVLTNKEYQDKINFLLTELARSDTKFDAFNKILNQMVDYNFITPDYVAYYINYRTNWRTKHS